MFSCHRASDGCYGPSDQSICEHFDEMRRLHYDAIAPLLATDHQALLHTARRELLGEVSEPAESVWELPDARRIIARQQADGRWRYPGGNPDIRSAADYDQLETYRQLGVLVYKFGLDPRHP